ncbi:type II toxin-antitoxin system VapC family toxin [Sinorhizobium meliloti]|uniref:type II toxin-antitoxin system VapC family toxin n=1 Tax=Rhizobium meliloti TaxID=382 RepID=UPI0030AB917D
MSLVDASVIVAILNEEAGFEELEKRIEEAGPRLYVSPLVRFEAVTAMMKIELKRVKFKGDRQKIAAKVRELVDAFIEGMGARSIVIDDTIGQTALDAMATYGKMVAHPADLNFGDCFAYAAAKKHRVKLLYKGNDFAQTDMGSE